MNPATKHIFRAFDDTRFPPIAASELLNLSCSLTLLTSFTPCAHALDWTLGLHGLRISFTHNGKRHGATYLPDVATDQGWTKEETVESLMRKAGWDGAGSGGSRGLFGRRGGSGASGNREDDKREPWNRVGDMRAVRYRGLKASASATEWREWRRWVDENEARKAGKTPIK
jgi:AMME syndrome candidate gene 1 protein